MQEIAWRVTKAFLLRAREVDSKLPTAVVCSHSTSSEGVQLRSMSTLENGGRYLNGEVKRRTVVCDNTPDRVDDAPCGKNFKKGRHCALMITHCLEHNCIIGWHLTPTETLDDVLAPIIRYWSEMPEHIVYDFACGLSATVRNRAYELLKHCIILHDKYHQQFHKECSGAFDPRNYDETKAWNTSLQEQVNVLFKQIRGTTSHGKLPFCTLLIDLLELWHNRLQMKKNN